MNKQIVRQIKRIRRHARIRAKIIGTAEKPRLSVFRSNRGMFLQLIDDAAGKTLVSASVSESKAKKLNKTELAAELGKLLAKKALAKKISAVVFDKGAYKFHGRVKAAAEGAREGGLKF
ncbi:MAG TPA: 50S ribosomal protein L18 [Candidatus Methylomirabilis sp.]|nr:50S ribosomal protein L18 [Candidatus Methylomirabilis sp.]